MRQDKNYYKKLLLDVFFKSKHIKGSVIKTPTDSATSTTNGQVNGQT